MIEGKKRCSWERRKEKDEERERTEKEKNEDAKEHKCAILQQAESFTQQRLKYCCDTGTHSHTVFHLILSFTLINCEYIHLSVSLHRQIKGIKTSRVLYSGFSVSACLSDLWIRYICNSLSAHLQNESCLHKWFWFYETAIANRVKTHFYVFNMLYYPLKQLH